MKRKNQSNVLLVEILIVVLFFVLDAIIGTGGGSAVRQAAGKDAVLMQSIRILVLKGC